MIRQTKKQGNYNHTIYASYIGYITQAIINNFAPLLFLTFQSSFHITMEQTAFLVTANFGIQLLVDMLAAKYVDRIGYRVSIVAAHILAAAGLVGLAVFPNLFPSEYAGIMAAIFCYAIGGGLIEVLISPIVEACPTEKKEAAMSLLHSFYCWGHVFVILMSTFFFFTAGIANWRILACLWAAVPFLNAFFFLKVPIQVLNENGESMPVRKLIKNKMFWVLFLLMLCAGASEQAMSQWASAFAESALKVSKTVGDLAGPCTFAVLMGTARVLSAKLTGRFSIRKLMVISGVLCVISYLVAAVTDSALLGLIGCGLCGFSVGVLWPGTFSMGAAALPAGGTAMFALLALAGDVGCSAGPTFVGIVSARLGDDLRKGILAAVIFPVMLLAGIALYKKISKKISQSGTGS